MGISLTASNPFRVLGTHRNFRLFWIGQTLSLVGTWMQAMALGWLALELTNSAFLVGLVAVASSAPILLFSLHAGAFVDRSNKLVVLRTMQTLFLIEAVLLWLLTWSGHVTIGWILSLALFGGTIAAIEIPARQSLVIDFVGRDQLREAIALNSSGFNIARIVGPALAALVIAHAGLAWCFAINAASFFTVLAGLARVSLPVAERVRRDTSLHQGVREVLAYVRTHRPVRALVAVITVFSVLAVPVVSLMPVVARDLFHTGSGGYGGLLSAIGVGGMLAALVIAGPGSHWRHGRLLVRASHASAVCLLLLPFVRSWWLGWIVLFGVGFFFIANNAAANTLLQVLVPDELRGRMMSIYGLIVVGLAQVLGASLGGLIAQLLGVGWAIGGAAALLVLYLIVAFRRYPELREL
ncbi:MAG: MFS transporter [Gemmatimonadaceae bacterium]